MKSFFSLATLAVVLLTSSTLFAEAEQQEALEPQVAGRFYPGNETALKDQINAFFKNVQSQEPKGRPVAIIAPHAGYQYSGQVAAYGYKAIKDCEFERVIILALKHNLGTKRVRGVSIINPKHFKTPLGLVNVDQDACNQLLNTSKLFGIYDDAFKEEHSLETQLPFLQMTIKNFKLVPLMVCFLIQDDFDQVANAIKPLITNKTLLVVSSDFTHYGENYNYVPFKSNVEKNIRKYDYGLFERILAKDFDGVKFYRQYTGITACGIFPIALLLKILPADVQGEILNYDTSGRQLNDFSSSVSYASIIFTKPSQSKSGQYVPKDDAPDSNTSFGLSSKDS